MVCNWWVLEDLLMRILGFGEGLWRIWRWIQRSCVVWRISNRQLLLARLRLKGVDVAVEFKSRRGYVAPRPLRHHPHIGNIQVLYFLDWCANHGWFKLLLALISHSAIVADSLYTCWEFMHFEKSLLCRSCVDLQHMICLYRRTTGPIRRAKGGWTAEEVSLFLLKNLFSFLFPPFFGLNMFVLVSKADWIGNPALICNVRERRYTCPWQLPFAAVCIQVNNLILILIVLIVFFNVL
jgi:hypothetical protein